jgi:hypothetical protein
VRLEFELELSTLVREKLLRRGDPENTHENSSESVDASIGLYQVYQLYHFKLSVK